MIIIDAHEDIAWSMLRFGREYTRSVNESRELEVGTETPKRAGTTLLGWDEWIKGRVAVIFATLFASPFRHRLGSWDTHSYESVEEARQRYRENLDIYNMLVTQYPEKFKLIFNKKDLKETLHTWETCDLNNPPLIGLVILMEGADAVRNPDELPEWFDAGLRILGPTWVSTQYSGGTREPGPLTKQGFKLLDLMYDLGIVLDVSHLAEEAALQSIDYFEGDMIASHSNPGMLLPVTPEPDRHLTDEIIRGIAKRDGVIGICPYNEYIQSGWKMGDPRDGITMENYVTRIDYVCQLLGSVDHVGIGSDFDGGFGLESVPEDINSIADMIQIGDLLEKRGYSQLDIEKIFSKNWLRILERSLPPD